MCLVVVVVVAVVKITKCDTYLYRIWCRVGKGLAGSADIVKNCSALLWIGDT